MALPAGHLAWVTAVLAACAGQPAADHTRADAGASPDAATDAALPDAIPPDAAPAACHTSRNPTGDFAITAIRSTTSATPGNTWASVPAAATAGIAYIEIDVRLSQDGRLIPAREDDVATFSSDCAGSVRGLDAAALAGCHYKAAPGVAVLPLEAGFEGVDFAGVYLDLKFTSDAVAEEIAPAVAAVAAFRDATAHPDAVVAMVYGAAFASAFVEAGARTGWKGYPAAEDAAAFIDQAGALGVEMACMEASHLGADLLDHAAGVGIWTLPWEHPSLIDQSLRDTLFEHGAGGLILDGADALSWEPPPPCSG